MKIHGLRQIIKTPTRSTEKNEILIDHLWVSEECTVSDSGTVEGLSDHAGIYATLRREIKKPKEAPRFGRTYKNFCPNKTGQDFLTNITRSSISEEIANQDIEKATNTWIKALQEAAEV